MNNLWGELIVLPTIFGHYRTGLMTDVKLIQKNNVPAWILKHLNEVFSDIMPRNMELTLEQLRWLQGQRTVIDYLESLNEDDVED